MSSVVIYFFFSRRRRHTRWNCDWSSDVCSSDLRLEESAVHPSSGLYTARGLERRARELTADAVRRHAPLACLALGIRSEERRVGKECMKMGGGHEKENRLSRSDRAARYHHDNMI